MNFQRLYQYSYYLIFNTKGIEAFFDIVFPRRSPHRYTQVACHPLRFKNKTLAGFNKASRSNFPRLQLFTFNIEGVEAFLILLFPC